MWAELSQWSIKGPPSEDLQENGFPGPPATPCGSQALERKQVEIGRHGLAVSRDQRQHQPGNKLQRGDKRPGPPARETREDHDGRQGLVIFGIPGNTIRFPNLGIRFRSGQEKTLWETRLAISQDSQQHKQISGTYLERLQ